MLYLRPYAVVPVADALTQLIEQAGLLVAIATGWRGGFVRNRRTVHKNSIARNNLIARGNMPDSRAGLHSILPVYAANLLSKTR